MFGAFKLLISHWGSFCCREFDKPFPLFGAPGNRGIVECSSITRFCIVRNKVSGTTKRERMEGKEMEKRRDSRRRKREENLGGGQERGREEGRRRRREGEKGEQRGRGKSLFLLRITDWNYNGIVINTCKSRQERVARVRACNYIKFEFGWNLPRVLKIVTCYGQLCVAIVVKHVTGSSIFSTVQ